MKKLIVAVMLCFVIVLTAAPFAHGQMRPEIFITPKKSTAQVGETFTVNVNISDAEGVFSWEIKVRFYPAILVVSDYESGGFLEQAGSTLPMQFANKSDQGYVILGLTLSQPGSANGNGTLAKITFKVLSRGYSPIKLYDTLLYDEENKEIPHTTSDGSFALTAVTLVPEKGIAAFTIKGYGFAPNSIITMKWNNTLLTTIPEQVKSDLMGNFIAIATVPEQTTPGNYTITLQDEEKTVETTFEVIDLQGPPGEQGPPGPGAPMEYTWLAIILSIIAIIVAIYSFKKS